MVRRRPLGGAGHSAPGQCARLERDDRAAAAARLGSAGVTNATSELPAAPSVIDRLSRNAVDIVAGEEPVAAGSLRSFYVGFDIVALLLLIAAGGISPERSEGCPEGIGWRVVPGFAGWRS